MKRLFDLSVALFLIILLLPLFVVISILIRLDSPGPIFFKQTRLGQFKRPFKMLKFRSMHFADCNSELQITPAGDKRITGAGRWLRRLKLDELPQLFNVLVGDMSLVGPRPEVGRYVEFYPEIFDQILLHKPGVTDLATLDFIDEAQTLANSTDPEKLYISEILPQKLKRSQQYIESATFWGDLAIIARTLKHIAASLLARKERVSEKEKDA